MPLILKGISLPVHCLYCPSLSDGRQRGGGNSLLSRTGLSGDSRFLTVFDTHWHNVHMKRTDLVLDEEILREATRVLGAKT